MQYVREYFHYYLIDPRVYWPTTIGVCLIGYAALSAFLMWLDDRH